jgi:hypothetical protein
MLRNKYCVAIHLKFLHIWNEFLAIKCIHVVDDPCGEVVVLVNKTTMAASGELDGNLHCR